MIDRREKKTKLESNPPCISTSDILLNYSDFLNSSYKYLCLIDSGSYDPWDDFSESTFDQMVYDVLYYKLGLSRNRKVQETIPFGFSKYCYRFVNHIEVKPKSFPVAGRIGNWDVLIPNLDPSKYCFAFKQFGDSIHSLTFSVESDQYSSVNFDMVEVDIFESETGLTFDAPNTKHIWLKKSELEYHFVLEDYDEEMHRFHLEGRYSKNPAPNF